MQNFIVAAVKCQNLFKNIDILKNKATNIHLSLDSSIKRHVLYFFFYVVYL